VELPSRKRVRVLLASAVPLRVGRRVPTAAPKAGCVTTGADGEVTSTVKEMEAESALVLPAASVAAALTLWLPSARLVESTLQEPPVAVVVPTRTVSTYTLTVLPASALPLKVGCCVAKAAPSAGELTTGVPGATVSTVKGMDVEGTLMLPAPSVAVALKV
jgi:hypothetical protein